MLLLRKNACRAYVALVLIATGLLQAQGHANAQGAKVPGPRTKDLRPGSGEAIRQGMFVHVHFEDLAGYYEKDSDYLAAFQQQAPHAIAIWEADLTDLGQIVVGMRVGAIRVKRGDAKTGVRDTIVEAVGAYRDREEAGRALFCDPSSNAPARPPYCQPTTAPNRELGSTRSTAPDSGTSVAAMQVSASLSPKGSREPTSHAIFGVEVGEALPALPSCERWGTSHLNLIPPTDQPRCDDGSYSDDGEHIVTTVGLNPRMLKTDWMAADIVGAPPYMRVFLERKTRKIAMILISTKVKEADVVRSVLTKKYGKPSTVEPAAWTEGGKRGSAAIVTWRLSDMLVAFSTQASSPIGGPNLVGEIVAMSPKLAAAVYKESREKEVERQRIENNRQEM